MKISRMLISSTIATAGLLSLACDHGHDHPAPTTAKSDHAHGPNGEHATAAPAAGHGGPVIALGTATAGSFSLVVTRDQGAIEAGKDAPIDAMVTPAADTSAKAASVRFWIGTEDAKGSVKAKAEIENPAEPNRWHTHTEIPATIPPGAKLYVEVEANDGQKSVASFDLKQ